MTVDNLTGKQLKHYAQDEKTNDRYVVIALQNDVDPNTCSVVPYDKLDSDLRSELLAVVNSDECQRTPDIWKVLDKRFFYSYPKQTMLQVLRALRQILVVDQSRVRVEITPDLTMTPKEIINAINVYESEKNNGSKDHTYHVDGKVAKAAEAAPVEVSHNDEIKDMDKRLSMVEDKINMLTGSISELISALKTTSAPSAQPEEPKVEE